MWNYCTFATAMWVAWCQPWRQVRLFHKFTAAVFHLSKRCKFGGTFRISAFSSKFSLYTVLKPFRHLATLPFLSFLYWFPGNQSFNYKGCEAPILSLCDTHRLYLSVDSIAVSLFTNNETPPQCCLFVCGSISGSQYIPFLLVIINQKLPQCLPENLI